MVTFVQELVNSLSVASVIILMGIGVTLIFGLTGIINFAHGEFLMLGAIGVWVLMGYGLGYIPALIIAVAVVGLIGFLLERGLFQFTLNRPNNGFMASLGLSIVLQTFVLNWDFVGGARGVTLTRPATVMLFGSYTQWLFVCMVALALVSVGVARWIERSWVGRGLAALRDDEQSAECAVSYARPKHPARRIS